MAEKKKVPEKKGQKYVALCNFQHMEKECVKGDVIVLEDEKVAEIMTTGGLIDVVGENGGENGSSTDQK